MEELTYLGFLSMGFSVGFGHCLGMCHPFVLYISGRFVGDKKGYRPLFLPHIMYNLGRITTYALLGLIAGFAGNMVQTVGSLMGIQKAAAVFAGLFLIIYGLFAFAGYNFMNKLESKFGRLNIADKIKRLQPKTPYITGVVLGFLPCGPLYGMIIASASTADALRGMVSMVLFGTGTMAALLLASVFGNFLMAKRGLFNMLSLIIMTAMGIFFIWSGLRM
ncbi:MAG: sulfite exporter TauE/SafE family protein [Deferribacterales bacterium]